MLTALLVFLGLLALIVILATYQLLRGAWRLPEEKEKRERLAIGTTAASLLLGLGSLAFALRRPRKVTS